MKDGRRFGAPPKPYQPPATPPGKINITDPDSRLVKGMRGWLQGYNAQAVVNEQQIVIAAEVIVASPDFGHLEPMLDAARRELDGRRRRPTRPTSWSPTPATGTSSRWTTHRRRHPGADPARRRQAQDTRPGLERRPLRLHAQRAGHRARRRALPQTQRSSSRSSRTPNTTAASTASTDEAEPPSAPNGA